MSSRFLPRLHRPADGGAQTLGDALASLGHDPHDDCPAAAAGLDPDVWLVRSRPVTGALSLLIVDFGDSFLPGAKLLRAINRCTRSDHIRVLMRRGEDHGRARSLLPLQPPAPRAGPTDGAVGGRADPGASR